MDIMAKKLEIHTSKSKHGRSFEGMLMAHTLNDEQKYWPTDLVPDALAVWVAQNILQTSMLIVVPVIDMPHKEGTTSPPWICENYTVFGD
jgi:hypothetical protein